MQNKEKNFASAVIYVHNAGKTVEEFLSMVIPVLENNFSCSEVICVNDCSSDDSVERIKKACKNVRSATVSIVNMSYFHGLEIAMNAGVDLAIGDFVFEFDNALPDFEPEMIMEVYRRSLTGFDIVSAVPARRERISSRMFYRLFDRYAELPYEMHTESFRVLSRRVINRISSMTHSVPYRKPVYANQGLKTDSIRYKPVSPAPKKDRRENKYRFRLGVDSLMLFTNLGCRVSAALTVIMLIVTVASAAFAIAMRVNAQPVAGWVLTVLFLSLAFCGLFAVLSIVIKYLQILVNMMFKRKQYSYEGIEKITTK